LVLHEIPSRRAYPASRRIVLCGKRIHNVIMGVRVSLSPSSSL
jgi:hypothetical protein